MQASVSGPQWTSSTQLNRSTRRWILLTCCLASMAVLIDPPLWAFNPPTAQLFDAELGFARLLTSISGIATAIFLLGGGLLGDFYGRRRMLFVGLGGAVVANVLILFSSNVWWFGICRIAEAIFGSMVLPLALALLFISFDDKQRGGALAIFATCTALATQIAWVQGTLLASLVGWRAPFILPTLLAVVTIVIILRRTPESFVGHTHARDTFSYMGWTLIVLATLYALLALPVNPDLWQTISLISVGVAVVGITFVISSYRRAEHTASHNSKHSNRRTVELVAFVITGVILNFALVGVGVRFFGFFQVEMGMSILMALIAMAPLLVGSIIAIAAIINNVRQRQARAVIAAGMLGMGLSIAVMALLPRNAPYLAYFLPLTVFGLGYLLASTVWMNVFLRTAVRGYFGLNAAMNKASSVIGAALGAVVTGNMLTQIGNDTYADILQNELNPRPGSEAAIKALTAFESILTSQPDSVLAHIISARPVLLDGYLRAYGVGFNATLWLMAGLCFVAAFVIGMGLRGSVRATPGIAIQEGDLQQIEDVVGAEEDPANTPFAPQRVISASQ